MGLTISSIILWTVNMEVHIAGGYAFYALVLLYTICFAMAWGPNGWVIPSEGYPLRLRGKGAGLATLLNWTGNFVVAYITPLAINSPLGVAGYMMIFAVVMIFTVPFLNFMMPETKDVPLEEMEAKFDKSFGEYIKANGVDLRKRKNATKDLEFSSNDCKV